jgi:hypothetical protein
MLPRIRAAGWLPTRQRAAAGAGGLVRTDYIDEPLRTAALSADKRDAKVAGYSARLACLKSEALIHTW